MAIVKKQPKKAAQEEAYIAKAPDAQPTRWQRGDKTQVTISLSLELLNRLDEAAREQHLNRSSLLTVLINQGLARMAREAA